MSLLIKMDEKMRNNLNNEFIIVKNGIIDMSINQLISYLTFSNILFLTSYVSHLTSNILPLTYNISNSKFLIHNS